MSLTLVRIKEALARGYTVDVEQGALYNPKGREIRGHISDYGYRRIGFYFRGHRDLNGQVLLHQMVAHAKFGDAAVQKGTDVRHLDGNRLNNRGSNIAIGSRLDNHLDRPLAERQAHKAKMVEGLRGLIGKNHKLSPEQVREIRAILAGNPPRGTQAHLARRFAVSPMVISYIKQGKRYFTVTD